ncbi:25697_t:CDS:1, partial [Gigaspora margarita]
MFHKYLIVKTGLTCLLDDVPMKCQIKFRNGSDATNNFDIFFLEELLEALELLNEI